MLRNSSSAVVTTHYLKRSAEYCESADEHVGVLGVDATQRSLLLGRKCI